MTPVPLLLGVCCWLAATAHATSFGFWGRADIASVDNKPAICLPSDAKEAFAVGWIALSESFTKKSGVWSIALRDGADPLVLKPGECMVYGRMPPGYEQDVYPKKRRPLELLPNRTYVFQLSHPYRTTDTYTVAFCINKTPEGELEYLEYIRLPDGTITIPPCDARRHGNVP